MSFEVIGVRLVAENADGFAGDMAKAQKAVDDFGQGASGTFKQMPGLSDIVVGALHRIGEVAVNALGAAAQATGQFLADSVSKAGDFQQGMLEFQAVAGKGVDTKGLDEFHDLFIQLGKDLPVSTADVQQAAIELVKGGIDPATVAAGGLKQSIQFAAAAMNGDLAAAAEVSAKIVGGWADVNATAAQKADLLTHGTDLLTKAANASTVDVHDLALGLYNVQGTAKTAGLSLDDTTTALAELAPRFADANTAGTSFRNFLIRTNPTTKPAISAMEDLGLYTEESGSKFFDAQGKFIGVAQASQLLQDHLKGLTDQQKTQALQTIFGNDAMNAAAAFADLGAKGYDNMTASLDNANGVSENAALKQQGYNTALENAKGSVEALQITLGEKLLPVLTDLLNNVIAPAINTVTTFTDALFGNQEAFNNLSPTLQSVVTFFTDLSTNTGGLSGLWTDTLYPAIQSVGDYFEKNIWPILEDLGTALFPLVGAAIQVLSGFWTDVLQPALKTFWDFLNASVIPILKDVAAWLAENLPPAIKAVADFLTGTLFPAFHKVYDFIDQNVIPIVKDIVDWLREEVPIAVQAASDFWNNVLWPALQKVWTFINTNVVPIFQTVVAWLRDTIPPAVQKLADFWNNILWPALKKVWDFISTSLIPLFTALVDVHIAALKTIVRELAALWDGTLYPAIVKVSDWFGDHVKPILIVIGEKMGIVSDKVNKDLGPAFQWLSDHVLQPVANWLGTIGDKIKSVIGFLDDLAEKINNLPDIPSAFKGGSPPPLANWMGDIATQTHRAASAFGSLGAPINAMPSSPMALMAAGNTTNATYNQNRNVNLNYHTTYAPPPNTSLAIAQALGAY